MFFICKEHSSKKEHLTLDITFDDTVERFKLNVVKFCKLCISFVISDG